MRHDPLWSIEDAELAARYHRVLRLLARGDSDDDIARAMGVRKQTVWGYIKDMLAITGARNRTNLIALYMLYVLRGREHLLWKTDEPRLAAPGREGKRRYERHQH